MKQNLSDLSISVGDSQVFQSSKVRDLGVVFDQYLTFHDHISGICRSTHFHLRSIRIIRNLLTFDATAQRIHALITTRLDFVAAFFITFQTTRLNDYNGYKTRQHVCSYLAPHSVVGKRARLGNFERAG